MTLTRRDVEDGPVFDTLLHPAIELHGHETGGGIVIYDPDGTTGLAAIHCDVYVDTCDWR